MPYHIKITKGGKSRKVTGYSSLDAAVAEAQAIADDTVKGGLFEGAKVVVDKDTAPRRRKNGSRRPGTRKKSSTPKRKAHTTRRYKGHTIRSHKDGKYKYVVEPYGHKFATLAAAKQWVDGHVRRESPKVNPAPPRKATKRKRAAPAAPRKRASAKKSTKAPAKKRKGSKPPLSKRVDLSASRIDWSKATLAEIKAIGRAARKQGKISLADKADAAAARRSKKK